MIDIKFNLHRVERNMCINENRWFLFRSEKVLGDAARWKNVNQFFGVKSPPRKWLTPRCTHKVVLLPSASSFRQRVFTKKKKSAPPRNILFIINRNKKRGVNAVYAFAVLPEVRRTPFGPIFLPLHFLCCFVCASGRKEACQKIICFGYYHCSREDSCIIIAVVNKH